jgi:DNA invertase Pin-like site-specific DNA recombinase
MTKRPLRAIIYTRISQDQIGDAKGVARQEEACRQLCAARGYEVVRVEQDNSVSAWSNVPRPAFERALAASRAGECDVIIAWAVDRLTRNMRDLQRLVDNASNHGVAVATVDGDLDLTTAQGKLIATILAAVGQAEVEQKAARQKLANSSRARSGGRTVGVRPFGYTDDQRDTVPAEADAIRKAAQDVIAGVTLSAIAREWDEAGFTTSQRRTDPATGEKRHTTWSAPGVRYVLTSKRYIGKRVYQPESPDGKPGHPEVYDATWPPILDEHTFDVVGEVLRQRGVDTRPDGLLAGGMKHQNFLAGIAVCSCHGTPVRSTTRKGPTVDGKPAMRKVYVCRDKHLVMEREAPDVWVEEVLLARLEKSDAASLLGEDQGGELETLRTEKVTLQTRLDGMVARYMEGRITDEQFDAANEKAGSRLREVDARLAEIGRATALGDLVAASDVRAAWAEMGMEQRRLVLGHLVERLELCTDRRGLTQFRGEASVNLTWRRLG